MKTAFSTFKKSKNETVKAQIAEFDPKAEEDKVYFETFDNYQLFPSLIILSWNR
jgi:hypothetical protein